MTPHRAIQSVRQEWITRRLADRIDAALKEVAAARYDARTHDYPNTAILLDAAAASLARALRLLGER